jgi:hypothetical protein
MIKGVLREDYRELKRYARLFYKTYDPNVLDRRFYDIFYELQRRLMCSDCILRYDCKGTKNRTPNLDKEACCHTIVCEAFYDDNSNMHSLFDDSADMIYDIKVAKDYWGVM